MTKEALAVLALPKKHNMTLHGHGWRPLDVMMLLKLILTGVCS
jgi:hypothetical protein